MQLPVNSISEVGGKTGLIDRDEVGLDQVGKQRPIVADGINDAQLTQRPLTADPGSQSRATPTPEQVTTELRTQWNDLLKRIQENRLIVESEPILGGGSYFTVFSLSSVERDLLHHPLFRDECEEKLKLLSEMQGKELDRIERFIEGQIDDRDAIIIKEGRVRFTRIPEGLKPLLDAYSQHERFRAAVRRVGNSRAAVHEGSTNVAAKVEIDDNNPLLHAQRERKKRQGLE